MADVIKMQAPTKSIFSEVHPRLVFCCLVQSFLGGACFYGETVLNVPQELFKTFLRKSIKNHYGSEVDENQMYWLWTILVASTTAGPLVGSLMLNYLSPRFGRRDMVMVFNNLVLILGSALQVLAIPLLSYECLLAGRTINGIVIGLWSIVPVYLAECSPDSCRGLMSMTVQFGWTFWLLMGAALGLPEILGREEYLPYLGGVAAIPAVIQIFLTPLFPKSPKYLYISEQKKEEAAAAVRFYHGDNVDMDKVLGIIHEYEREAQLTAGHNTPQDSVGLLDVVRVRHLWWPFLICIVASLASVCAATDVTANYSTELLETFGLGDQAATIGTVISLTPPFLLSFISPFVVEFFGRRKITGFGIACGLVSVSFMFIAGLIEEGSTRNGFALVGVILSNIGLYSGFGAIVHVLPGELAPEGIRPITAAASALFCWGPSFIILMAFPPTQDAVGSYSYLPFIVFGVLFLMFLYFYMPETKGRAVDDIIDHWVKKPKSYLDETAPLLMHKGK